MSPQLCGALFRVIALHAALPTPGLPRPRSPPRGVTVRLTSRPGGFGALRSVRPPDHPTGRSERALHPRRRRLCTGPRSPDPAPERPALVTRTRPVSFRPQACDLQRSQVGGRSSARARRGPSGTHGPRPRVIGGVPPSSSSLRTSARRPRRVRPARSPRPLDRPGPWILRATGTHVSGHRNKAGCRRADLATSMGRLAAAPAGQRVIPGIGSPSSAGADQPHAIGVGRFSSPTSSPCTAMAAPCSPDHRVPSPAGSVSSALATRAPCAASGLHFPPALLKSRSGAHHGGPGQAARITPSPPQVVSRETAKPHAPPIEPCCVRLPPGLASSPRFTWNGT